MLQSTMRAAVRKSAFGVTYLECPLRKTQTNITVDQEILERARAYGFNDSLISEQTLAAAVRAETARRSEMENAEAIAAWSSLRFTASRISAMLAVWPSGCQRRSKNRLCGAVKIGQFAAREITLLEPIGMTEFAAYTHRRRFLHSSSPEPQKWPAQQTDKLIFFRYVSERFSKPIEPYRYWTELETSWSDYAGVAIGIGKEFCRFRIEWHCPLPIALDNITIGNPRTSRAGDLPLRFHPVAIRASTVSVTP